MSAPSLTSRAVASCHGPRSPPRASHGAIRTRDELRNRLTLPASPALTTHSVPPCAANHTGVATSAPLRRNVARLR